MRRILELAKSLRSRSRKKDARRNRRLLLEQLEDRRLLAYFVNGAAGAAAQEFLPDTVYYVTIGRDADPGPRPDWPDALTVGFSLSGTATPGKDYTLTKNGACTIPVHEDTCQVPFTAIDDPWYESANGPELITVTVTSVNSSNYEIRNEYNYADIGDDDYVDGPQQVLPSCPSCGTSGTGLPYRAMNGPEPPPGMRNSGGPPGKSEFPMRYFDGAAFLSSTDLMSDAFGTPWGVTRDWTKLAVVFHRHLVRHGHGRCRAAPLGASRWRCGPGRQRHAGRDR